MVTTFRDHAYSVTMTVGGALGLFISRFTDPWWLSVILILAAVFPVAYVSGAAVARRMWEGES